MSRIWKDQIRGTMNVALWQRATYVTIWSLSRKVSRDILARSPSASGETSKRRTSSFSTSIEIEKPWSFHNLGCPEIVFQAWNSRVNDCVKELSTNLNLKCHKKTKARHTLTGSSTILLLPDYQSKSLTVDITEILRSTCNICERNIFTATAWSLQTLRKTLPNEPRPMYCPMVGTVTKSVGLMVARKRRAVESVLAKRA